MSWFPSGSLTTRLPDDSPDKSVSHFRDLLVTRISDDTALVVACDSSGAIGPKPHDYLQVSGREAGRTTAKVPLMEVVAAGAIPMIVVDNLSVEMDPTGHAILEGVRDICRELDSMPVITGSDETNIPTVQTGIGITVIGTLERNCSRLASSQEGDQLIAVGLPLGGPDGATPNASRGTATVSTVRQLLAIDGVREILPVGSKGIRYEIGEMARTAGLGVREHNDPGIDMTRSAGASAVVMVSVAPGVTIYPGVVGGVPCTPVGELVRVD